MHIMQELPTNKANFLIKITQDFNSSRHAAPHLPIVFTDNIILYFNYKLFCVTSFQKVTQWHVMGGYCNADIFVKCRYFYAGFDFTTVFQDGGQVAIL